MKRIKKNVIKIQNINTIMYIHCVLLFFMLLFRSLIDITLLRDICLIILIVFYGGVFSSLKNKRFTFPIKLLLIWGVVVVIVHIFEYSSFLDAIVEYRNFFLPLVLYPFSTFVLNEKKYRIKWINIIFILFLILLIDIYLEFFLEVSGLSRDILPWYPYQYTHLYRFNTAPDAIPNAINPADAPILGLGGWPNATSAILVSLFAFFIPYIFSSNSVKGVKVGELKMSTKYLLLVLTVGALMILEVKMAMLAFGVVLFVYFLFSGTSIKFRFIIPFSFLLIVAYVTKSLWLDNMHYLIKEAFGDGAEEGDLYYMFDIKTLAFVVDTIFTSPLSLLFGNDVTKNSMYSLLEIRILNFTLQMGVIWLILILILFFGSIRYVKYESGLSVVDTFALKGSSLAILAFFVDFFHYANVMYGFRFTFFMILLSFITTTYEKK